MPTVARLIPRIGELYFVSWLLEILNGRDKCVSPGRASDQGLVMGVWCSSLDEAQTEKGKDQIKAYV
jgi:hypothetical protein